MAHAIQALLELPYTGAGPDPYVLMVTDVTNAFNELKRRRLLLWYKEHHPNLYPLVYSLYRYPSKLHWRKIGKQRPKIGSKEGAKQGCALGGIGYCGATAAVWKLVQEQGGDDVVAKAYYDDGFIWAPASVAYRLWREVLKPGLEDLGLTVNSKSWIYRRTPGEHHPPPPAGFTVLDSPGFAFMKVPHGEPEHVRTEMIKVVEGFRGRFTALGDVKHVQSRMLLIMFCCATRMNYWLRCVPPVNNCEAAKLNDELLLDAVGEAVNIELTDYQRRRLQLPTRHGGANMHSAVDNRSIAYSAAVALLARNDFSRKIGFAPLTEALDKAYKTADSEVQLQATAVARTKTASIANQKAKDAKKAKTDAARATGDAGERAAMKARATAAEAAAAAARTTAKAAAAAAAAAATRRAARGGDNDNSDSGSYSDSDDVDGGDKISTLQEYEDDDTNPDFATQVAATLVSSTLNCIELTDAAGCVNEKLPRFNIPLKIDSGFTQAGLVRAATATRFKRLAAARPTVIEGALLHATAGQEDRNDASAWLVANGHEYFLDNATYQFCFAWRYGAALPPAVAPGRDGAPIAGNFCNCAKLKGRIDSHGYHLVNCMKGGMRTHVHDAINRVLAWGARELGKRVQIERKYNLAIGRHHRADFIVYRGGGGKEHYDVVTSNPLKHGELAHRSKPTYEVAGADVKRAEAVKISTCGTVRQYEYLPHDGDRAARGEDYMFYPIGIGMGGCWGAGLQRFFGKLMKDAVEDKLLSKVAAASFAGRFRKKISIAMQRAFGTGVIFHCAQIRSDRQLVRAQPRARAALDAVAAVAHRRGLPPPNLRVEDEAGELHFVPHSPTPRQERSD